MLVLPGQNASELAAAVRAETYMMALDDVPFWAVEEALRLWYRGEHGQSFDYRWAPEAATLRRLALVETQRLRNRISVIDKVLSAQPRQNNKAELDAGMAAMRGLNVARQMGDPEVLKSLTFAKAIELGRENDE